MINVLYHIAPPEQAKGNTKIALEKLDINQDGARRVCARRVASSVASVNPGPFV